MSATVIATRFASMFTQPLPRSSRSALRNLRHFYFRGIGISVRTVDLEIRGNVGSFYCCSEKSPRGQEKSSTGDGLEGDYFFLPRITSLAAMATRNLTTFLAGILIASPVAGFLPLRALRFRCQLRLRHCLCHECSSIVPVGTKLGDDGVVLHFLGGEGLE